MSCLDDDALLAIVSHARPMTAAVQQHLASCSDCRLMFAAAARGASADDTARGIGPSEREGAGGYGEEGELEPEALYPGARVANDFVLVRPLGQGAMGVVWAAQHTSLTGSVSHVALKIARSTDPELARRFAREVKVAQALSHPHIAKTYDVLPAEGRRGPVIVMELLVGETLDQRLERSRALPLAEACRIMLPIVSVLETAHARGVVHRDLKPSNVMLVPVPSRSAPVSSGGPSPNQREDVRVLDFGIAKLLSEWGGQSTRLTRTGATIGTPRTMAPEQIHGESTIDARTDIWALGVVFYRALSGRYPLDVHSLGEILKALRTPGAIVPIERLCPGLPLDVAGVLMQALEIPRATRLADVRYFLPVLARHAQRTR